LLESTEVGFRALVGGRIEAIELSDSSPLVSYRGRYRNLSEPR